MALTAVDGSFGVVAQTSKMCSPPAGFLIAFLHLGCFELPEPSPNTRRVDYLCEDGFYGSFAVSASTWRTQAEMSMWLLL